MMNFDSHDSWLDYGPRSFCSFKVKFHMFFAPPANSDPVSGEEVLKAAMTLHTGHKIGTFSHIKHVLSCDNDKKVQDWILRTHSPEVYVKEIQETTDSVAFCEISKDFKAVPHAFFCFCSWVCHDVSLDCQCFTDLVSVPGFGSRKREKMDDDMIWFWLLIIIWIWYNLLIYKL